MSIALFRELRKNLGAPISFFLLLLIPSEMKAIIRWAVALGRTAEGEMSASQLSVLLTISRLY